MTKTEISKEFKLEFLNEILSDTANLRIISSKQQLIATGEMAPVYLPIHANGRTSITHFKFIADSLGVGDTTFIRKQFEENKNFDFNDLSKFGFRVFDIEKFKKSNDSLSIYDYTEKINEGYDSFYRVMISKPIFNKELNKAYIMIDEYGGRTLVLEKKNGKWTTKSEFNYYVE